MKDKILGWTIVVAALAGIAVFIIVMASWVNGIINAPDCDGTKQPVCKIVATPEKPKEIPLPDATEIENRINAFRSEKGLSLFADNAALDQAAAARADGMCATNDWTHDKDWATLAPYYNYQYAGENLYFGYLQEEQAANAVRDWLNSPGHRANIEGNYTEFGIAVKSCPGFQNEPTAVIITNYFGVPR